MYGRQMESDWLWWKKGAEIKINQEKIKLAKKEKDWEQEEEKEEERERRRESPV